MKSEDVEGFDLNEVCTYQFTHSRKDIDQTLNIKINMKHEFTEIYASKGSTLETATNEELLANGVTYSALYPDSIFLVINLKTQYSG